ncbi:AlpA family transcriptional regulator (plasmid) [Sinorhizobium medicae WSM1115]|nr:AlpA family phage regulatory protein [Sinorhizobium medicae]UFX06438.1 AlpA family transcriptional regulator [Sinorhizobium medicae WSM1115]
MPSVSERPVKRSIRRNELREIVPLADSTIYEMEQRGEFPRRFGLSPRCVVWDLAEVEAWLESPRSGSSGRSKGRVGLKHRHGRGEQGDWPLAAFHPRVNDVRPFLEHMAALNLVSALL